MLFQPSAVEQVEKLMKERRGVEFCLPSFICSFFLIQFRGRVALKGYCSAGQNDCKINIILSKSWEHGMKKKFSKPVKRDMTKISRS